MRCWNDVTIQRKNGSRGRRNDLATHKVVVMMINMNANCFNAASIPSANNSECIHLNKTKQNKTNHSSPCGHTQEHSALISVLSVDSLNAYITFISVKITVSFDMTPTTFTVRYQHFGRQCYCHLQSKVEHGYLGKKKIIEHP